MRYGSLCSGIEAASMAWSPFGWEPVFFSEIERFPSAVLARHYGSNLPGEPITSNGVPNLGDMTKFEEWPDYAIDLLVGGTPCQSFSIAGLRKGLADPRGNLMLTYLAIAARYRPTWLVWENVPGALSVDGGTAFASLIGGMAELGYHAAWRVLDAQYVRVDGYGRAVPQRRRRLFVVGYLGDWRRAAAVFLEREGLHGHSAPRRETGKRVAPTISARPTGGGGLGTDFDCDGGLVVDDVARCVTAGYAQRLDWETENFVAFDSNAGGQVAVAIQERAVAENPESGPDGKGWRDDGAAYTVEARQVPQAVAAPYTLAIRGRGDTHQLEYRQDGTANAVLTPNGGRAGMGVGAIADQWAVRRLTPRECERLQGFPDDFTRISWRGKQAAGCPDGPRYKALGNSMAVNCMRWIGRRIEMVEAISRRAAA
jgi:DNA (cytosine-5)-methyltransferase 1